jgi:hypothetical protein
MTNLRLIPTDPEETAIETTPAGHSTRMDFGGVNPDDDLLMAYGVREAVRNQANSDTYQMLLLNISRRYEGEANTEAERYSRREADASREVASLMSACKRLQEEELPARRERIRAQEAARERAIADPHSVPDAADFDAGKLMLLKSLLIALSCYLFIFYFFTGHAALVRNIGTALASSTAGEVSALFETVFDAGAVVKDLATNPLNVLICLFFPMVFFGVGYLLHDALEERRYGRLVFALAVTAGLDLVVAYSITSKLYDARRLAGLAERDWQFAMAFTDVNFYLILLAGMAVYVCWGAILSLVMTERRKGNKVSRYLAACAAEIVSLEREIDALETDVRDVVAKIETQQATCRDLELLASPQVRSWSRVEQHLDRFTAGWAKGVEQFYQEQAEMLQRERRERSSQLPELLTTCKNKLRQEAQLITAGPTRRALTH